LWGIKKITCHPERSRGIFQSGKIPPLTPIKSGIGRNDDKVALLLTSIVVFYLLFNSILIAANQWVALYKMIKIIEFILLGMVILKIKPKFDSIILFLSVGAVYSSIIAILQFILQRSVGGILWFLGERTFYASTPGIAALSVGGRLLLRPYATFPHPNVLGGFLAVVLPMILAFIIFNKKINKVLKIWLKCVFIIGFIALFLTFSRAAWSVFLFGILFAVVNKKGGVNSFLVARKNAFLVGFYSLLLISVSLFFFLPLKYTSFVERYQLISATISMVSTSFIFGVGLNNFVIRAKDYLPKVFDFYIFQPVHNVYLLIFAELGMIGFVMFMVFIFHLLLKSLKTNPLVTAAIFQIVLLGFFDHYLFTLQQGQLLFTLFASLAFLPQKN
jgi:O-antigen ligase